MHPINEPGHFLQLWDLKVNHTLRKTVHWFLCETKETVFGKILNSKEFFLKGEPVSLL